MAEDGKVRHMTWSSPSGRWINPYLGYIPRREKPQYVAKPGLVERSGWDFNFGPTCNVSWTPYWKRCDAHLCKAKVQPRPDILANLSSVVMRTKDEKDQELDTVQLIHRTLQRAWGLDYPRIDLYLRTGGRDQAFIRYLVESIHLYWPRFLGRIIFVLDFNDRSALEAFIPPALRNYHDWLVVYEHTPCMSGRIFNQYSYLNLFRYTDAEYVVTIDSDCVFTVPITPDRIFNEAGMIILPVSSIFQSDLRWNQFQGFFTNESFELHGGHSMITQPVNFHVDSTFSPFFEWAPKVTNRSCYEERLADMISAFENDHLYCWMCQLNVFVSLMKFPRYEVRHVDSSKLPYQRIALHVKWEKIRHTNYDLTVKTIIRQSLCWYLTDKYMPECRESEGPDRKRTEVSYTLFHRAFHYGALLSLNTTEEERREAYFKTRGMWVWVLEDVVADG